MAKKTVKIMNNTDSVVSINLKDFNEKIIPLKAKSNIMIDEDELTYIMNTSRAFELGTLIVMNKEALSEMISVDDLETPNALTEKDIEAMLKKSPKVVSEQLSKVDNIKVVEKVLEIAKSSEKVTAKVLEAIEERISQLHDLA